jgi:hypothetical protein
LELEIGPFLALKVWWFGEPVSIFDDNYHWVKKSTLEDNLKNISQVYNDDG